MQPCMHHTRYYSIYLLIGGWHRVYPNPKYTPIFSDPRGIMTSAYFLVCNKINYSYPHVCCAATMETWQMDFLHRHAVMLLVTFKGIDFGVYIRLEQMECCFFFFFTPPEQDDLRSSAFIYMLFTNREVHIENNFAQGRECTDQGHRPRSLHSRPKAKFFSIRTDQGQ